jgi:trehalose 6-phosphate synthase/phosphatase
MESELVEQYSNSSRRLFLLDYDGTLANFTSLPKDAHLDKHQFATLKALCQNAHNTVVIISGRDHHTLNDWLADLPINLAAEYGHLIKEQGKPWVATQATSDIDWKETIRPILQGLVAAVPGSFVEEKEFSLVWHYWDSDEAAALKAAEQIHNALENAVRSLRLAIKPATKVLEVTVPGVDKSTIAEHWLSRQNWDFIMAAGDDVADEDLFKAMPEQAFTVKIGPGSSAAGYRLPDPEALSVLLQRLNAIG